MKLNTKNRCLFKAGVRLGHGLSEKQSKILRKQTKCHLTKDGQTFYTCNKFNEKFKDFGNLFNNSFMTREAPYKFLLNSCPFCKTDLTPYSFEEPSVYLEEGQYTFLELYLTLVTEFPFTLPLKYAPLKTFINRIHKQNVHAGWWNDPITGLSTTSKKGEEPKCNVSEKLCLIHSEISEALEGYRKNLMDDKLPTRSNLEVELADALIRICDLSAGLDLDLTGAVIDKLEYNKTRADHKIENRLKENGKKF